MKTYCTLFDRNYLARGLALYRSLERHAAPFVLHVLCMDDEAHALLTALALPHARLLRFADIDDAVLQGARADRSVAETCWTCSSVLLSRIAATVPAGDTATYLDADLLFFSTTAPLHAELDAEPRGSLQIVAHNFAPAHRHLVENGLYNVQWVTVRNDDAGRSAVDWWRDRCLDWCYNRLEDGKFGDQKYLDDWPTRFPSTRVLAHPGGGVGPWNFARYRIEHHPGHEPSITVDGQPLVFFHFHRFALFADGSVRCSDPTFMTDATAPRPIYDAYVAALRGAYGELREVQPGFSAGIVAPSTHATKQPALLALRRMLPAPVKRIARAVRSRLEALLG